MRGHFITLEGMDGAGKSTLLNVITAWHATHKIAYHITREPGGTPLGETLRTLLLHEDMDLNTEALLMFAARQQHINQIIRPKLAQGISVISDRFTDATFAYQGGGRGFDLAMLSTLEHMVQTGLPPTPERLCEPDVTLWFDLPVAVAAQRLAGARSPDRFEAQSQAFFERVSAAYAARAAQAPQRFVRIDAAQSLAQVAQQLQQALCQRGWLKAAP